jgi:hypothetical protein
MFWGCLSFLLCRCVYKRLIKINYIRFERGEKALSFGKRSFLSASFYQREIGVNIFTITFASYVTLPSYICPTCFFLLWNKSVFIAIRFSFTSLIFVIWMQIIYTRCFRAVSILSFRKLISLLNFNITKNVFKTSANKQSKKMHSGQLI